MHSEGPDPTAQMYRLILVFFVCIYPKDTFFPRHDSISYVCSYDYLRRCLKYYDGMVNIVDPDQTAPLSGSTPNCSGHLSEYTGIQGIVNFKSKLLMRISIKEIINNSGQRARLDGF